MPYSQLFLQLLFSANPLLILFCSKTVSNNEKSTNKTLELILSILLKKVDDLDVPLLSPFKIQQLKIDLEFGELGKINGTLENIRIDGLSATKIDVFK